VDVVLHIQTQSYQAVVLPEQLLFPFGTIYTWIQAQRKVFIMPQLVQHPIDS